MKKTSEELPLSARPVGEPAKYVDVSLGLLLEEGSIMIWVIINDVPVKIV